MSNWANYCGDPDTDDQPCTNESACTVCGCCNECGPTQGCCACPNQPTHPWTERLHIDCDAGCGLTATSEPAAKTTKPTGGIP